MTIDLDTIKLQYPLIDVVEAFAGPGKRSGSVVVWNCPLPGHDEKTPSFKISDSNPNRYHCYGCGKNGDIFQWVKEQYNITNFLEAVKHYTGEAIHMSEELTLQMTIRKAELQEQRLKNEIELAKNALTELQDARAWLRYQKELAESEKAIALWEQRGIPKEWHEFFMFGYAPKRFDGSDSITIPVRAPYTQDVTNIMHRIIGRDKDKYRPEQRGLKRNHYYAYPEIGVTNTLWIVEGEIKADVAFYNTFTKEKYYQFVGTQQVIKDASMFLDCQQIKYVPDYDTSDKLIEKNVLLLGREKTTIVDLPEKVDDMLNDGTLSGKELLSLGQNGRKL